MAEHSLDDLLNNSKPDTQRTHSLLYPPDQRRIEKACMEHAFGSKQAAEVVEAFAVLADHGYNWRDVLQVLLKEHPHNADVIWAALER